MLIKRTIAKPEPAGYQANKDLPILSLAFLVGEPQTYLMPGQQVKKQLI
tara:strand:- start:634 stop:780 length:147 start_codon:yes stop_codon:yes gene_type:complete